MNILDIININSIQKIIEKENYLLVIEEKVQWKLTVENGTLELRGKILDKWSPILLKVKLSEREYNKFITEATTKGIVENFKTKLEEQKETMSTKNWWVTANENNIERVTVNVTKVIDGDTLHVKFKTGEIERIRLRYIDTPEIGHYDNSGIYRKYDKEYCVQGIKATNELKKFIKSKNNQIEISFRVEEDGEVYIDKYGRVLAYLKEYSEMIVEKGLALPMFDYFIPPTLKSKLISKMNIAKEKEVGLFNKSANAEKRRLLKIKSETEQKVGE